MYKSVLSVLVKWIVSLLTERVLFLEQKTLWSSVEQMGFSEICSQMLNLYKDIHLLSCFLWFVFFFVCLDLAA